MTGIDDLWSIAMQEAVTLAPSTDVILHTIEIRVPTDSGFTAFRCVLDYGTLLVDGDPPIYGHMLTLEADAPLNPSESVAFVGCMFEMSLPAQNESPPSIELTVDNVTQQITQALDAAVGLNTPIEVTYREYLASDPATVQYKLPTGVLQRVSSLPSRVRGSVVFNDFFNTNFPAIVYRPSEFPSLQK